MGYAQDPGRPCCNRCEAWPRCARSGSASQGRPTPGSEKGGEHVPSGGQPGWGEPTGESTNGRRTSSGGYDRPTTPPKTARGEHVHRPRRATATTQAKEAEERLRLAEARERREAHQTLVEANRSQWGPDAVMRTEIERLERRQTQVACWSPAFWLTLLAPGAYPCGLCAYVLFTNNGGIGMTASDRQVVLVGFMALVMLAGVWVYRLWGYAEEPSLSGRLAALRARVGCGSQHCEFPDDH